METGISSGVFHNQSRKRDDDDNGDRRHHNRISSFLYVRMFHNGTSGDHTTTNSADYVRWFFS